MTQSSRSESFPPLADANAGVLILGSMPGAASLQAGQYYAHPRNAFWPIMGELFGMSPDLAYPLRQACLKAHGIAVWDVLQSCSRQGSLDANIDLKTAQINDFTGFYQAHKAIARVYFNGGMAEKLYRQRVMPSLGAGIGPYHRQRLPSTSPAYAALTLQQKIAAWQVIKSPADQ